MNRAQRRDKEAEEERKDAQADALRRIVKVVDDMPDAHVVIYRKAPRRADWTPIERHVKPFDQAHKFARQRIAGKEDVLGWQVYQVLPDPDDLKTRK